MRTSTKLAKSFTIDREVAEYVEKTRSGHSASERVNEMLTRAMRQERYERFAVEAEEFFRAPEGRTGTQAFQSASIRAITRD
jgi:hypothetical protein